MKNRRATLVLHLLFSVFLMVGGKSLVAQSPPTGCVFPNEYNDSPDPWSSFCYFDENCMPWNNGMCGANDLEIQKVTVVYQCIDGQNAMIGLTVTIQNGGTKYAARVFFEIWDNGQFTGTVFNQCISDVLPPGNTSVPTPLISITCGDLISVRNVWISWRPNGSKTCAQAPNCEDYGTSHCYEEPTPILLLTPGFTFECQPNSYEVCYTGSVNGGNGPFVYSWLDINNNVLANTKDFCITYANAGPHTIKFRVTDADGSNVTIIQDNVICAVLPIELTTFTAKETNRTVHLAWSTASEQNNHYFSVERSGPEYAFQEIATIPGAVNSTEPRFYEHVDKAPLAGLNYYRLKQVDTDGAYTYSPAVQVRVGLAGKMNVYPSPAADRLQISLSEPTEEPITWNVYDVSGRLALTGTQASDVQLFSIALGSIPEGVYVVQVFVGREVFVERFIKK